MFAQHLFQCIVNVFKKKSNASLSVAIEQDNRFRKREDDDIYYSPNKIKERAKKLQCLLKNMYQNHRRHPTTTDLIMFGEYSLVSKRIILALQEGNPFDHYLHPSPDFDLSPNTKNEDNSAYSFVTCKRKALSPQVYKELAFSTDLYQKSAKTDPILSKKEVEIQLWNYADIAMSWYELDDDNDLFKNISPQIALDDLHDFFMWACDVLQDDDELWTISKLNMIAFNKYTALIYLL